MRRTRVIPVLLLKDRGFYKTQKFKEPKYLGDPINILKIFNDKEVDEIGVFDIGATAAGRGPQIDYLGEFTSECFMPLAYGGGISTCEQIGQLFKIGVEKCIINSAFHENPNLIKQAAGEFGSQSIVVSIDAKKRLFGGNEVCTHNGTQKTGLSPLECAKRAEDSGAGEILLNSIDRDGMMTGYDTELAQEICAEVSVPVILCGGVGSVEDLKSAANAGAAAAGSFFCFPRPPSGGSNQRAISRSFGQGTATYSIFSTHKIFRALH